MVGPRIALFVRAAFEHFDARDSKSRCRRSQQRARRSQASRSRTRPRARGPADFLRRSAAPCRSLAPVARRVQPRPRRLSPAASIRGALESRVRSRGRRTPIAARAQAAVEPPGRRDRRASEAPRHAARSTAHAHRREGSSRASSAPSRSSSASGRRFHASSRAIRRPASRTSPTPVSSRSRRTRRRSPASRSSSDCSSSWGSVPTRRRSRHGFGRSRRAARASCASSRAFARRRTGRACSLPRDTHELWRNGGARRAGGTHRASRREPRGREEHLRLARSPRDASPALEAEHRDPSRRTTRSACEAHRLRSGDVAASVDRSLRPKSADRARIERDQRRTRVCGARPHPARLRELALASLPGGSPCARLARRSGRCLRVALDDRRPDFGSTRAARREKRGRFWRDSSRRDRPIAARGAGRNTGARPPPATPRGGPHTPARRVSRPRARRGRQGGSAKHDRGRDRPTRSPRGRGNRSGNRTRPSTPAGAHSRRDPTPSRRTRGARGVCPRPGRRCARTSHDSRPRRSMGRTIALRRRLARKLARALGQRGPFATRFGRDRARHRPRREAPRRARRREGSRG